MKFSVLISVYDGEEPQYLEASLESIYAQTLPADEVVMVADGPLKPELERVIATWQDLFNTRMRLVRLQENKGLAVALNAGLAHCSNDWVARMDTDDVCLPNRLKVQAEYIQNNPDVDVVGSLAITINERGEKENLLRVPVTSERIQKLIWACPFIHPSVCFKKTRILALGGYNPDAGPRQDDYELWYRCAAAGYVMHNIPQALILFRFTDKSIRRNTLRVGFYRLRNGLRGNRGLGMGFIAYVGVIIPFLRALMPYPVNVWIYKMLNQVNPRTRS